MQALIQHKKKFLHQTILLQTSELNKKAKSNRFRKEFGFFQTSYYNGIFPCFLYGRDSFLLRNISSA